MDLHGHYWVQTKTDKSCLVEAVVNCKFKCVGFVDYFMVYMNDVPRSTGNTDSGTEN